MMKERKQRALQLKKDMDCLEMITSSSSSGSSSSSNSSDHTSAVTAKQSANISYVTPQTSTRHNNTLEDSCDEEDEQHAVDAEDEDYGDEDY